MSRSGSCLGQRWCCEGGAGEPSHQSRANEGAVFSVVDMMVELSQREKPIDDGVAFLRSALAGWDVHLDGSAGRQLREGRQILGTWEWRPAAEVAGEFTGAPWLDTTGRCPFVGPPLGYLLLQLDDYPSNPAAFIKEGRGAMIWPATGQFRQCVVKRRLPLVAVVGKLALEDGAALLDQELAPYREAVLAEIDRAVRAAGWDGPKPVELMQSSAHNIVYWSGAIDEREASSRFGNVLVDLWLYDFDALYRPFQQPTIKP